VTDRHPPPSPEDFEFFHGLRVRWAEVDPQGIVFNAHYLTYADVAFTEYMRTIGFPYPDGLQALGTDLFAVSASLDYQGSARFDDELEIGVRVERIGRTSIRFLIGVFRNGLRDKAYKSSPPQAATRDALSPTGGRVPVEHPFDFRSGGAGDCTRVVQL